MAQKNILVTGGAGYIGSHTVLQLLLGGFNTVVVDNLDNSSALAIERVKELAADFAQNLSFHKVLLFSSSILKKRKKSCRFVVLIVLFLSYRLVFVSGFWFNSLLCEFCIKGVCVFLFFFLGSNLVLKFESCLIDKCFPFPCFFKKEKEKKQYVVFFLFFY